MVVLEGDFAYLCVAGFPLSPSMQLQTGGLKFADAMWTAKSSTGGFSVSFFWPSVSSKQPVNIKVKKQKRRKRERGRQRPREVLSVGILMLKLLLKHQILPNLQLMPTIALNPLPRTALQSSTI